MATDDLTRVYITRKDNENSVCIRSCSQADEPALRALFYEVNYPLFREGFQKLIVNYMNPIAISSVTICFAIFKDYYRTFVFGIAVVPLLLYYGLAPLSAMAMAKMITKKDKDFKNGFVNYYKSPDKKRLLICVESNHKIVGMCALDEADIETKGHHKGLRKIGDAEMKRMNVAEKYRGMGLSKLMFHIMLQQCKDWSSKRLVLTTSSFNYVACNYLYPKLGFVALNRNRFGKDMEGVFFSLDLQPEKENESRVENEKSNENENKKKK